MSKTRLCLLLTALVCIEAPALTGCGGSKSTPGLVPDSNLVVTPAVSSLTIYPGSTQTLSVATTGTGNTPFTVTVGDLPSGVSLTSSPTTLLPGDTAVLTLTAAVNADAAAFPPTAPGNPNSATIQGTVKAIYGSMRATAPLALTVSLSNPSFTPAAGQINLPILAIDTGGTPVTSTTTNVSGTILITSADGSTTYLPSTSNTDNTATFHVHGNTTAMMPKLPYHMKLGTSVDLLSLMGLQCPYVTKSGNAVCDKSKSYILLANYDDKSLLRDWSASALGNAIPYGDGTNGYLSEAAGSPTASGTNVLVPWAPHSLYVELFLNGQYEGNYQLIEEVKVDSHRVNIPELTEQDTSGDLSGGYLLEMDGYKKEEFMFNTPKGLVIGIIDPEFSPDPEVPAQTTYISQYVRSAEDAMFSANYTDPLLGWRAYFDEASMVNYYLVTDVTGNYDGGDFFDSVYFYKTVDNPLIYMGPLWDFDVSAGNAESTPIVSPTAPWAMTHSVWFKQLFTDAGFAADVQTQWNALKSNGVLTNWIASIAQQSTTLTQSAQNNFTRWPMIGETVWPNVSAQATYADSVSTYTDWLNQRIGYLDSVLTGQPTSSIQVSGPRTATEGASVAYAVQVSGGRGVPTGTVTLLLAGHRVGSAALDGTGHAQMIATAPVSGELHPLAVYIGDRHYAMAQTLLH
jgi:hypothetical protein